MTQTPTQFRTTVTNSISGAQTVYLTNTSGRGVFVEGAREDTQVVGTAQTPTFTSQRQFAAFVRRRLVRAV